MSSGNRIPVITINREYGAGGRTIAKGLSERFGIPWYDQDIITEIARDTGYSEEDIVKTLYLMYSDGKMSLSDNPLA